MRIAKMLALAALAALAAMSVMGATASVSQAGTVLCNTPDETPCAVANRIGNVPVTSKLSLATQATLRAENNKQEKLPDVTCQKSEVSGATTGNDGTQVLGEITSLKFTECTAGKLFTCTVEELQLPYNASDIYTEQNNGTFTVFAKAPNEQPGARVSCPIVGLNCIFKVNETNAQNGVQAGNLIFVGGNPATVVANEVQLKPVKPAVNGNCLEIKVSKWIASYEVTAPKPVYQSKDQA